MMHMAAVPCYYSSDGVFAFCKQANPATLSSACETKTATVRGWQVMLNLNSDRKTM